MLEASQAPRTKDGMPIRVAQSKKQHAPSHDQQWGKWRIRDGQLVLGDGRKPYWVPLQIVRSTSGALSWLSLMAVKSRLGLITVSDLGQLVAALDDLGSLN